MKKFYHRRKVWRQRLLAACQTPPCEAASASFHGRALPGLSRDCHLLQLQEYVKRLELDDPRSDFRFQACPGISSPDSRKAFRDLRVVRTPEVNLRYLRTGENCLPNFP